MYGIPNSQYHVSHTRFKEASKNNIKSDKPCTCIHITYMVTMVSTTLKVIDKAMYLKNSFNSYLDDNNMESKFMKKKIMKDQIREMTIMWRTN